MYCKKCGADIPDQSVVCPYCRFDLMAPAPQTLRTPAYREGYTGSDTDYEQPVYEQPVYEQPVYEQPVYEQPPHQYIQPVLQYPGAPTPQQQSDSNSLLVFGILGLAFACTFFLSFLGIVFSAITKGKSRDYLFRYGEHYGKAKVGRILANIGLPVGIVLTCLFVFYLIFYVILASYLFTVY